MNTELKPASSLQGLARRLVAENILDQASAENASVQSNKKNQTLLAWLIKNNAAKPQTLATAAAAR